MHKHTVSIVLLSCLINVMPKFKLIAHDVKLIAKNFKLAYFVFSSITKNNLPVDNKNSFC